jgi:thiol-disulfide isomerase/thioredoxin
MNETENGEPKKSKKIAIVLVIVAIILGVYYFNKPVVNQNSEQVKPGEEKQANNEGAKEESQGETSPVVDADSIIGSVEVKTSSTSTSPSTPTDSNVGRKNALAVINALISSPVAVITMEPKEAADKAVNYVNKYIVPEDQPAKIVQVFPEKLTYYKFIMNIAGTEYPSYVSADGKSLITGKEYDLNKNPNTIDGKEFVSIADGFYEVKGAEVCKESGKPIVYFFGSKSCPHCTWEQPIVSEVAKSFGTRVSYHENIDNDKDQAVLDRFSPQGGIPVVIIGCKYFKIGSGETIGSDKEKAAIISLINNVLK